MAYCLPIDEAKKLLRSIGDGSFSPDSYANLTSTAARRAYIEKFVGKDNAIEVNTMMESKMLLKDWKRGMVTAIKQVTGLSEARKTDLISKVERVQELLSPTDETKFYADITAKRLGTDITFEEAKKLATLSSDLAKAKANINESNRLVYGAKNVELQNYVNDLKLSNDKTTLRSVGQDLKTAPASTLVRGASNLAGIAKGIKASLDDSALFRQGWKTVFTNPGIWMKNAINSFANITKQLALKPSDSRVLDGIKAEIYSRPNALNGLQAKAKLDVGNMEEAYPSTLPEKLPLFGRLYKASETAYTGFLYRMRADIFDKYIKMAEDGGVDLTDKLQVESIGRLVNSLTGRGSLGAFEKVGKQVNTIFFSPKMVKSSFDFLTLHAADKMSTFARKQAALNLLKVTSGIALLLGVAQATNPNSVEFDPRSADFGKIRIKDTRFDVTGGMSSLITLAIRMLEHSTKSSTTGVVSQLNTGKFGAQTTGDVFVNYFTGKLSPAASVIKDVATNSTFGGGKPTVVGEAINLLAPLPVTNAFEVIQNPNGADALLTIIADALGISTNTYSPKKK